MEWTQLRVAEAGWDLSLSQMNLLTERVYQRATGPRTLYFPILKPILAVAAMAALIFGLLLLWPKKPVEEQIVILPGSSSEARPGEYVEKEPTDETLPSNENQSSEPTPEKEEKLPVTGGAQEEKPPATDGEQAEEVPATEDDQEEKPAEESEKTVIHRFWETEEEMPYEEAVAIVKEKVENRPFEPLTDKERMAYYQCIFKTYYVEYLFSYRPNQEKKDDELSTQTDLTHENSIFSFEIFTTKDGIGLDLWNEYPLSFDSNEYEFELCKDHSGVVLEVCEDSYVKDVTFFFVENENGGFKPEDRYVYSRDLEYGLGRAIFEFEMKGVNFFEESTPQKTAFQEVIRHYLSIDSVIWVDIYYGLGHPVAEN